MSTEIPLLDIKLLRLLDQLYATRSVTRAAEALGQSQPTVSIWLARLRKNSATRCLCAARAACCRRRAPTR